MNYDNMILGCGNSQHPANKIETSYPETEKLSITAKFEVLEGSNFEAEQCNEFYLELAEIEKKAANFDNIAIAVKRLNAWKSALKEIYNEKAFKMDSDYKRSEIQNCLDQISKQKKLINKICGL